MSYVLRLMEYQAKLCDLRSIEIRYATQGVSSQVMRLKAYWTKLCDSRSIELSYTTQGVSKQVMRLKEYQTKLCSIKLSYVAQLVHIHRDFHTSVNNMSEFASTSITRKSNHIRPFCVNFAHILKCSIAAILYCRLSS